MCAHYRNIRQLAESAVNRIVPILPKEIDQVVLQPGYLIGRQPEGMIKNCATDRRYHDVDDARMDEMMDLISQLRTVFSIVGK